MGAAAINATLLGSLCSDFTARKDEISRRLTAAISESEAGVLVIGGCVTEVLQGSRSANEAARVAMDGAGGDSPVMEIVGRQRGTTEEFLGEMLEQLQTQRQRMNSAKAKSSEIVGIAAEIAHIANTTKFLSLNARIEATRLGNAGQTFAVLADEMVDLARSVRAANERVSELAEALAQEMPLLVDGSERLVTDSQAFGGVFREHVLELTKAEAAVSQQQRLALEENERIAEANLGMAQKALSHLQFQDPMAQSLARVHRIVNEFESVLVSATTDGEVDPNMWHDRRDFTIGSRANALRSVDPASTEDDSGEALAEAGEVMLF